MARLPKIVWQKAEWLVVEKGRTLEEAAEITGISLSALKRASAARQWMERRRGSISFSDKMRLAAGRMAEQFLNDVDAKPDGLLKIAKTYKEMSAASPDSADTESLDRIWKAICDAIAAEGDAELKAAWDNQGGKVKAAAEAALFGPLTDGRQTARKGKSEPMSPETAARIRNQVLGVTT